MFRGFPVSLFGLSSGAGLLICLPLSCDTPFANFSNVFLPGPRPFLTAAVAPVSPSSLVGRTIPPLVLDLDLEPGSLTKLVARENDLCSGPTDSVFLLLPLAWDLHSVVSYSY